MNVWPPLCPLPAADAESTFGLICVVLAALLLAGIALGFWLLRAWLGIDAGRGRFARRITSEASDLCATWRLYRQMGRGDHFSVTDIPSAMVPDSIAENARNKSPASGPITAITG
jgi:hypothetical protein